MKFQGTSQDVETWFWLFTNLEIRLRLILSYFENGLIQCASSTAGSFEDFMENIQKKTWKMRLFPHTLGTISVLVTELVIVMNTDIAYSKMLGHHAETIIIKNPSGISYLYDMCSDQMNPVFFLCHWLKIKEATRLNPLSVLCSSVALNISG